MAGRSVWPSDSIVVLLVEDNPADAGLFRAWLEGSGEPMQVRHVERLAEVQAALDAEHVDVVLLDLGLPDSQGLDTVRRMLELGAGLPVVALTGMDDEEMAVDAVHLGVRDYVSKQRVDEDALRRVVRYTVAREHTDRQRSELERRLRALLEHAPSRVILLNGEGSVDFLSRHESGWTPLQVGDDLLEVTPSHQRSALELAIDGVRGGRPSASVQLGDLTGERWHLLDAARVEGTDDLVVHVTDLTELRRLQREVERAKSLERVGEIAAVLSHELNNQLMVIIASAESLALDLPPDAEVEARMRDLTAASTQLAALGRKLLTVGERQVSVARSTDLSMVIRSVRERLAGHEVIDRLVWQVRDQEAPLWLDPEQVSLAVTNLVHNAAEATADDGSVCIRVGVEAAPSEHGDAGEPAGRKLVIEVRDDGSGMDEATLAKAVEPFFTTRHARGGAGLGLSSARSVVDLAGGTLDLESEQGRGTTVRLTLPLRPMTPPGPSSAAASDVCIVTSDETLAEAASTLLADAGIRVECARPDAVDSSGFHQLRDCRVVIVEAGHQQPGPKGWLSRLLGQRRGSPVLVLSHHLMDLPQARDDPGVHLIMLPYSASVLLSTVRRLLLETPAHPALE